MVLHSFRRIAIVVCVWTIPDRSPMAPCPASTIARFPTPPRCLSSLHQVLCPILVVPVRPSPFPIASSPIPPIAVRGIAHIFVPPPVGRRPHPRHPSPCSRTLPVIPSLSPSPCSLLPLAYAKPAAVLASSPALTGDGGRLGRSFVSSVPFLRPSSPAAGRPRGAAGLVLFARGWSG